MKKNIVSLTLFVLSFFLTFKTSDINEVNAKDYSQKENNISLVEDNPKELWWMANANVTATNLKVTASIYNGLNRPIYCIGRVFGNTYYNNTIWVNFEAVVNPGSNAYGYIYTNPRDPFVNGNANIQCKIY